MLRVVEAKVFIGRNLFCPYPAIAGRLAFDEPPAEGLSVDSDAIQIRLRALISALVETVPASALPSANPGGDQRETSAQLVAWLAAELQNLARAGVTDYGVGVGPGGALHALCAYQEPTVGRIAMTLAGRIMASVLSAAGDLAAFELSSAVRHAIRNLVDLGDRAHIDLHTQIVVNAARERGIPHYPIQPAHRLVQIGQGARQRYMIQVMSDRHSHIGAVLCRDKRLSHNLLRRIGLPAAAQRQADTYQHARRMAGDLGYPVVVKPSRGLGGRGVTVDVRDPDELAVAFRRAADVVLGEVLIEEYVRGQDYRLLMVGGRLEAAAMRIAGHVTGDGRCSVKDLMADVNSDPQRGVGSSFPLVRLVADDEAQRLLVRQGHSLDTVPAVGEVVYLRATANMSTGGTADDVYDTVHPSVCEMAEAVARAFKVDVMAIDYITPDIGRSREEVGGAICEVNECPGLRPHAAAGTDMARILNRILDLSFEPGDTARIPIAMITGTSGKTTTARMVVRMLEAAGLAAGLACSDGVSVGRRMLRHGDCAGGLAAQMLLFDPTVEAAVLETARGGLIRHGVPVDQCDVAAVLNVSHEHLGQDDIQSVEALAAAKALIVGTAMRFVVLNADDPHCVGMAAAANAPICWVTRSPDNRLVAEHLRSGGVAVTLDGSGPAACIVIDRGAGGRVALATLAEIPLTRGGLLEANVTNAMFAVAIGEGLRLSATDIAAGLAGLASDFSSNPGRFNFLRAGGRRIVVDRASSIADLGALRDLVDRLPVSGRRILAFTHAGNRRDEDVLAFAARAAGGFDHYVCYDWDDLRGRRSGEVAALLGSGLERAGVSRDAVAVIPQESEAVAHAARATQAGDLLALVLMDDVRKLRPLLERIGIDQWDCADVSRWTETPAALPPGRHPDGGDASTGARS